MDSKQRLEKMAGGFGPETAVNVGVWFGMPCLKAGRKVFAAMVGADLVFKLAEEEHARALQLQGARLFEHLWSGRIMKEWVLVPAEHSTTWSRYSKAAYDYVSTAAQKKKDELISGLVESRRKIMDAAASLPLEAQDEVFLGQWSIKELLAHLVGWDHTNRQAVQEILDGQKASFWQHYDKDWRSYNARLVAAYMLEKMAELLASADTSHQELITFLQEVPAGEYVKHGKICTLLKAEATDEETHYRQVKTFLDNRTP
jgi:hypothetical protein